MKSEPKGRVNLSGALLKNDYIRQGKRASGRAILFSALIALAAGSAGTWYFVWKKGGRSSKTAQQITQNPSYSNQQALQQKFAPLPVAPPAAVAPPPAPVANTQPLPSAGVISPPAKALHGTPNPAAGTTSSAAKGGTAKLASPAPAASAGREEARPSSSAQQNTKVKPARKESAKPDSVKTAGASREASYASASAPSQQSPHTMPAPASIKVTGIAWQDDRSLRRAVINDLLLKEGNVVYGAKITEIRKDRVKFSLFGSAFEVPLVSNTPQGSAGK